MDPDVTLEQARRSAAAYLASGRHADAGALADAFEALDEWLSKGGFLPKPWEREDA